MSYFPATSGSNLKYYVDGVQHKGKLKLKNEYIPIVCPDDVFRLEQSALPDKSLWVNGCVSLGRKLRVLSIRGRANETYGYITTLEHNLWSVQPNYTNWLYNRIGLNQKNYCNIGEDVYVVGVNGSPSSAFINKVNDDGTTTSISYTPGIVNSARIASFVNSDGDNCILVANYLYTDYAVSSYFYNLNTQKWTSISLRLPTGDNYVGDVYSSSEENVVYCVSNDGGKMYKYNVSSNTYTDISNWSTLTANQDKVGRVNKTIYRIPIICDGRDYHFLCCNIDLYYNNSAWQTKNIFVILDENSNVIYIPHFGLDESILSVCGHDNCIYILCDLKPQETTGGGGKFYKFDPQTRKMYDMSIPHLVIDKS